MRSYLAMFAVAIGLSLGGLWAIGVLVAVVAWMLHVVPETLGSLVRIEDIGKLERALAADADPL